MKGRFGILKAGIRVHGVNSTDKIWMMCCALHNLLIGIDGLSVEWEGEMRLHDQEEGKEILFVLRRLQNRAANRNYDTSGMGPGFINNNNIDEEEGSEMDQLLYKECTESDEVEVNQNEINDLTVLPAVTFRLKLITHFDVLFSGSQIEWPRRV